MQLPLMQANTHSHMDTHSLTGFSLHLAPLPDSVCVRVWNECLTTAVAGSNFILFSLLHVHEYRKNTCALLSPPL